MQTYFSTEFLAFFETLLQIRRPVLIGKHLVQDASFSAGTAGREGGAGGGVGGGEGEEGGSPASSATESNSPTKRPSTSSATAPADAAGRRDSGNGGTSSCCPPSPPSTAARGQFDQLRVSHRFAGSTYGELARELIERGAMPLGLYRPAGTKDSTLPYTHVNPRECEPLRPWPEGDDSDASGSGSRRGSRSGSGQRRGGSKQPSYRWGERTSGIAHLEGDSVFVLRSKTCCLYGSI